MTIEPAASCLSNFTLDRHLVGELTTQESRTLETHLADCASCQGRLAELVQFNSQFAEPCPPFSIIANDSAVVTPLPWVLGRWKKIALSGGVVSAVSALAAIFLLWLVPSNPANEVRTKGGVRLDYHVARGGAVWRAGPNEELRENDAIQFIFSAAEPGFLAVFSVDGRGTVSSYYPGDGETAAVYKPEQSRLSTSTVLDAALGDEVFVAVFCKRSFQKNEAIQSLEKMKAVPEQFRFHDCSVETLRAKKVEP